MTRFHFLKYNVYWIIYRMNDHVLLTVLISNSKYFHWVLGITKSVIVIHWTVSLLIDIMNNLRIALIEKENRWSVIYTDSEQSYPELLFHSKTIQFHSVKLHKMLPVWIYWLSFIDVFIFVSVNKHRIRNQHKKTALICIHFLLFYDFCYGTIFLPGSPSGVHQEGKIV